MTHQTEIQWSEAQQVVKINTERQAQKLAEFMEESHEMTDARDLQYWIDETGKDIFFLIQNAPDLAPNIKNPLLNGCTLDEIWHIIPDFPECEDEETNEDFTRYFNHLLKF